MRLYIAEIYLLTSDLFCEILFPEMFYKIIVVYIPWVLVA